MKLRLLTIPFNPQARKFSRRQGDTTVSSLKTKLSPICLKKNLRNLLDEREKQLFEEMKKLRKEKSGFTVIYSSWKVFDSMKTDLNDFLILLM